MTSVPDSASFRDPDGRVFLSGTRVFRVLTKRGADNHRQFVESGLAGRLVSNGQIVESTPVSLEQTASLGIQLNGTTLVLEHPRIPFISYIYEWSFEMLRSAALLQLDIMLEALRSGFILKDATPYNVQFIGSRPIHIDIPSFEKRKEGEPWASYAQFCKLFLNPLLLSSLAGISFQPWMRGSIQGIRPEDLTRVLPWKSRLRPALLKDVYLQAWLNSSFSDISSETVETARAVSIPTRQIQVMVDRLREVIQSLKTPHAKTIWLEYGDSTHYSPEAKNAKAQFVENHITKHSPALVLDLGCNLGHFTQIAAKHSGYVVAFDSDSAVVDRVFSSLRAAGSKNILCLTMDLLDPSSGQGWESLELSSLKNRAKPTYCLCLALMHHLIVHGVLRISQFVEWLASLMSAGILEFVPKDDPMVKKLLRWREDVFEDYTLENFEAEIRRHFQIDDRAQIPGTGRVLFALRANPSSKGA